MAENNIKSPEFSQKMTENFSTLLRFLDRVRKDGVITKLENKGLSSTEMYLQITEYLKLVIKAEEQEDPILHVSALVALGLQALLMAAGTTAAIGWNLTEEGLQAGTNAYLAKKNFEDLFSSPAPSEVN